MTAHEILERFAQVVDYLRMKDRDIHVDYEVDIDRYREAVRRQFSMNMSMVFFPEYAMYMENPGEILYTFFSRREAGGISIRMDDIQHHVVGLNRLSEYWEDFSYDDSF